MITFHSDRTKKHRMIAEVHGGELVQPFECPERVDLILDAIRDCNFGEVREPQVFDLHTVLAIHDPRYVEFIERASAAWVEAGYAGSPLPTIWPGKHLPCSEPPTQINAAIGYYALAGDTAITSRTFEAALASKDIALSATAQVLHVGGAAFGLCRPPGHHAAKDQYGGYCFFNNAAISAQYAIQNGATRIAILDIDYHSGNGTEDIFYDRSDVLFVSIHADPAVEFPYYVGFAQEIGIGDGTGYNFNLPLPFGTSYDGWSMALEAAVTRIRHYGPDLLIVSLGVDTYEGDPLGKFRLTTDDYRRCGRRLGECGTPTVFLLEGGYAVSEIGINVLNVLGGFEGRG